jgi:phosphatidylserine/phosphatidylglycerophosphate/cardiolipin synthase-like enzyme
VIDGQIGYTSGMNIGQEHLDGGEGFDDWRDTQVRLVGEGAALLQAVFMVDWYNAVRENLFADAYFPKHTTPPVGGDLPVQILTSGPDSPGPDSPWAAIRQLYVLMIVSAQRHVFLQSPSFILDASIEEALKSAPLSGIDVRWCRGSSRPASAPWSARSRWRAGRRWRSVDCWGNSPAVGGYDPPCGSSWSSPWPRVLRSWSAVSSGPRYSERTPGEQA